MSPGLGVLTLMYLVKEARAKGEDEMTKIVVKAGNEHGHEITSKKAEIIVSTGGQVMVVDEGESGSRARIVGFRHNPPRAPQVSWASYGLVNADQAAAQAEVIQVAALIAQKATDEPSTWFESVPRWVAADLDTAAINEWRPEQVCYWARSRYHNGDVSYQEAWAWAIRNAKEHEQEVTS